ncbi:hypothetical protein D9611_001865 [Ephemerocybe angulata]|uniref:Uncharacterized protein n=2 Tax=Ephemerocybe angulata TaxID=980116 RepID=A0A8H6HZ46_9AGAR|nr:hypothetical protein D9611_001865 [Tulosesus angulatus]KAF6742094.1 hypothetical protein DFP72DRAFT_940331 [Tulosesus angulatus]KAF6754478.1 hypothetical protein DFP72DRAFT_899197 [Tulosesus angulatus]
MAPQTLPEHVPWPVHAARQLKYVIPGAVATYYIGTLGELRRTCNGENGSIAKTGALGAGVLGLTTVALFLYVILLRFLGREPDYRSWRNSSGALSTVIPALTGSIVVGWLLAVATLGQWSSLGYIQSVIGVTGVYALTVGLLGLIPVPKTKHKS